MRRIVVGVMGPGAGASAKDLERAYDLGKLIAQNNWVLLTGGRKEGVMNEASRGARDANGLVIGILPSNDTESISEYVDVAIMTDMGSARNNINVLSSDVVIACGMGSGTASEVALALKANKHVVLLSDNKESQGFFKTLQKDHVSIAATPEEAITIVKNLVAQKAIAAQLH